MCYLSGLFISNKYSFYNIFYAVCRIFGLPCSILTSWYINLISRNGIV